MSVLVVTRPKLGLAYWLACADLFLDSGRECKQRRGRGSCAGQGFKLLALDDVSATGLVQVRQLMGMDANSGALMIGDVVRVGQRLRFVVRDR